MLIATPRNPTPRSPGLPILATLLGAHVPKSWEFYCTDILGLRVQSPHSEKPKISWGPESVWESQGNVTHSRCPANLGEKGPRWGSNWGPFVGRQMEGVPNALPTGLSKRGNARARPGNEAATNGFCVEGGEEIGNRRISVKGGWARKGWKGG